MTPNLRAARSRTVTAMDQHFEQEPPVDLIDSQLLALLDDDISDMERESLEKRLISEPNLRKRLRDLQQSWEALGELPRKSVDQRFTSTTVEMIVTRASQELDSMPLAVNAGRPGRFKLLTLCGVMLVVGAASVYGYRHCQYRNQLSDLAVVDHLDALMHADDISFVRALAASYYWRKHLAEGVQLGRIRGGEPSVIASVRLSERTSALQALDDVHVKRIKMDWDDWSRLQPKQQKQLRLRYQTIISQPDAEQLLEAAQNYALWLEVLSPVESSKTASVSASDRLTYIINKFPGLEKDWHEQVDDEFIRQFAADLVAQWEKSPPPFLDRFRRENPDRNDAESLRHLFFRYVQSLNRWRNSEPFLAQILTPEQTEPLMRGLSESARKKNPEELQGYVASRMRMAFARAMFGNFDEMIEKGYEKLALMAREVVDLSPPDALRERMQEFLSDGRGSGFGGQPLMEGGGSFNGNRSGVGRPPYRDGNFDRPPREGPPREVPPREGRRDEPNSAGK